MTQMDDPGQPQQVRPLNYANNEFSGISRHDIATLALRLVGIYLLIQCLQSVPLLPMVLAAVSSRAGGAWPATEFSIFVIGYGLFCGIVGILLLILAPNGSRFLLPGKKTPSQIRSTGSDLQAVAFSVVGVVLAALAVRDLLQVHWLSKVDPLSADEGWHIYVGPGVQLATGVVLFLGGRGLARLWRSLRTTSYGQPID